MDELINDSFEGGNPNGWAPQWFVSGVGGVTTPDGGVPAGGGTNSFEQHWAVGAPDPAFLQFSFPNLLGNGAIFEFEYYQKYHELFDYLPPGNFLKQFIFNSDQGLPDDQEIYFDIETGPADPSNYMVTCQHILNTPSFNMRGNINGGGYDMPKDRWVHFHLRGLRGSISRQLVYAIVLLVDYRSRNSCNTVGNIDK